MAEFHTELITTVIAGFAVSPSILPKLHQVVDDLRQSVLKFSQKNEQQIAQFWIMMTTYQYHPEMDTVMPRIRLIGFRSTNTMTDVAVGKNKIEKVNFELSFTSSSVEFNDKIYSAIFAGMEQELIEKGLKLTKDSALDFEPTF